MGSDIIETSVFIVIDQSLSLRGLQISSAYTATMELVEMIEEDCETWGREIVGDILFMGTGDDGNGCEWLCGDTVPFGDIHDSIEKEFQANGHTPLLDSIDKVADRISEKAIRQDGTIVLFITDGEFGYLIPDDVRGSIVRIGDCRRMMLLVGDAYDDDIVRELTSSPDYVFRNGNHHGVFNAIIDTIERGSAR